jgi:hypothetical protein
MPKLFQYKKAGDYYSTHVSTHAQALARVKPDWEKSFHADMNEKLGKIAHRYDADVASVLANADLTDDAKERQVSALKHTYSEKVQTARTQAAGTVRARVSSALAKLEKAANVTADYTPLELLRIQETWRALAPLDRVVRDAVATKAYADGDRITIAALESMPVQVSGAPGTVPRLEPWIPPAVVTEHRLDRARTAEPALAEEIQQLSDYANAAEAVVDAVSQIIKQDEGTTAPLPDISPA